MDLVLEEAEVVEWEVSTKVRFRVPSKKKTHFNYLLL